MADDQTSPYLTTEELAALIRYDARTIRNQLKDSVLFEGVHYIRPFGGRKILFIREAIERDLASQAAPRPAPATRERKASRVETMIPMTAGGYCNG